jgi:hypothetical protein
MNEQISRAQAQAKTIEFLRDEYRIAKKSDVTMGNLSVAFPQGFIPYFDDDGDLISISISPESPQHVCDLLKEVETSTAAFNALIAWSAAQLLVTRSIPNRDVERFLISYLVGVKKVPTKLGRRNKKAAKNYQHAVLRLAVAELEREGFKPTRNDDTNHKNSACDIVAEAMAALRFTPQSFREIKRIIGSGPRVG